MQLQIFYLLLFILWLFDALRESLGLVMNLIIYCYYQLFFYKCAWLCIHFIFAFFLNYFPFQGPMNLKMFLRIIWLETIANFKVQNVKYAVST